MIVAGSGSWLLLRCEQVPHVWFVLAVIGYVCIYIFIWILSLSLFIHMELSCVKCVIVIIVCIVIIISWAIINNIT